MEKSRSSYISLDPADCSVGEYLRKLRTETKMTQKAVSDAAGYERSYLAHVEVGDVLPSKEFVINILDCLLWEQEYQTEN